MLGITSGHYLAAIMSQDYILMFLRMKVFATHYLLSINFAKTISFVTCRNNCFDNYCQK